MIFPLLYDDYHGTNYVHCKKIDEVLIIVLSLVFLFILPCDKKGVADSFYVFVTTKYTSASRHMNAYINYYIVLRSLLSLEKQIPLILVFLHICPYMKECRMRLTFCPTGA